MAQEVLSSKFGHVSNITQMVMLGAAKQMTEIIQSSDFCGDKCQSQSGRTLELQPELHDTNFVYYGPFIEDRKCILTA